VLLVSVDDDGVGVGEMGQLGVACQSIPLFVVLPEPPPQAERATLAVSSAKLRLWLTVFILIVFREIGAALLQVVCAEIGRHQAGEVGNAEEISWAPRRLDLKVAIALDQRACTAQALFASGNEVREVTAKQRVHVWPHRALPRDCEDDISRQYILTHCDAIGVARVMH
jgi:hypothetical protein